MVQGQLRSRVKVLVGSGIALIGWGWEGRKTACGRRMRETRGMWARLLHGEASGIKYTWEFEIFCVGAACTSSIELTCSTCT